jgi:threonine dehydratase
MNLEPGFFSVPGSPNLKLELFQHSGLFKARGAFNTIQTRLESGTLPAAGVIAASGGNYGAAVA